VHKHNTKVAVSFFFFGPFTNTTRAEMHLKKNCVQPDIRTSSSPQLTTPVYLKGFSCPFTSVVTQHNHTPQTKLIEDKIKLQYPISKIIKLHDGGIFE
jgi:hypothetical protein